MEQVLHICSDLAQINITKHDEILKSFLHIDQKKNSNKHFRFHRTDDRVA